MVGIQKGAKASFSLITKEKLIEMPEWNTWLTAIKEAILILYR